MYLLLPLCRSLHWILSRGPRAQNDGWVGEHWEIEKPHPVANRATGWASFRGYGGSVPIRTGLVCMKLREAALTKCKVHVDLGLHFYWLTIQLNRLVPPCLHCIDRRLLQHRRPLNDAKIFHLSGVRDRCFEYNTPFDMSALRIRGVLGIFPADSVSGHCPSRYCYPFVRRCGRRPGLSRTSSRRRYWSGA